MTKVGGCRVVVMGFGAIGRVVARELLADADGPQLVGVLMRSGQEEARTVLPPPVRIVGDIEGLVALSPDVVVECAGQQALVEFAPSLLDQGIDVMVVSTGALAADGILDEWVERARAGSARLIIPAGAIAGLDGLGAHKRAGLRGVTYTSIKPPIAWRGTPAEKIVDLDRLTEPFEFFHGTARQAALSYPKNANLAATVAIAGIGFEDTQVRLVADPDASGNLGIVEAEGVIGTMRVEMAGDASANPKTSASTAYSVVHALHYSLARLAI